MRSLVRGLLYLAAALGGLVASLTVCAQNAEYQWKFSNANGDSGWQRSPQAAIAGWIPQCVAATACLTCGTGPDVEGTGHAGTPSGTWPNFSTTVTFTYSCDPAHPPTSRSSNVVGLSRQTNPEGAPSCPDSGSQRSSIIDGSGAIGDGVCGSDGCAYKIASPLRQVLVKGGFRAVASVESEGKSCGQKDTTSYETSPERGDCVSSGANVACLDTGTNCGEVNGDWVCVPSVPVDACVGYTSGGVACGASAATPPGPDNGTPGTPAEPDATVQRGSQVTNYYNSTTVNNSSAAPTTGNPSDHNPQGSGGGACTGDGCGEDTGSASGGDTCTAAPSCSGDAIECAILRQEWLARCPDAPTDEEIGTVVGDPASPASESVELPTIFDEDKIAVGAVCPAPPEFDFMGTTFQIDAIGRLCEFLAQLAPIIMACAYLSAAFIVFGAVGRE